MAETMSMKVLAALNEGAKSLAEVTDRTGITRPKSYATLHQLLKEGKVSRSGPRGWDRGRWSPLSSDAAPATETLEGEVTPETRPKSTMRAAARLAS